MIGSKQLIPCLLESGHRTSPKQDKEQYLWTEVRAAANCEGSLPPVVIQKMEEEAGNKSYGVEQR